MHIMWFADHIVHLRLKLHSDNVHVDVTVI